MNICFNDNDPFAEENVSDTENDKNNVIDNDIGDDLDPFGSNSIENNIKQHINDKKFMEPTRYVGDRIKETIKSIEEIVNLSKKYDFNLLIFINPIHKTTYLDTNFNNFQIFKNELVQLTDYYDFSGLNRITTNNYYYYETSHYRDIAGELIKQRLFKSENNNFGIYVSKNNIDEHLENLKEQIKNYDLEKELPLKN